MRWLRPCLGLFVLLGWGCAALDQLAVGRSDRLRGAPFYVTYKPGAAIGPVLAVPVGLDPLAAEEYTSRGRGAALEPLLAALNTRLSAHPCCAFSGPVALPDGAPWLYVGSVAGEWAPPNTGIEQLEHEEYPPMIAHLDRPGPEWRAAISGVAAERAVTRVVLVRVAFSQFPKADRGVFGKKVVLGTNHEEPIRFLSAIDKPVEVLALTGLVLDGEGDVVRGGAEGIIGEDSPFWVQVLEAGRDIDTESIRQLVREARRADLPGTPLRWEAALDMLLHQLVGPW